MSKKYLIFLLLICNFICWQHVYHTHAESSPTINFLDVGQGESTLIQDQNTQIIIDAGPDESILHQISSIIPSNDRVIELIILSHPHDDHYQGFNYLLSHYQVKKAIINGIVENNPDYNHFLSLLDQQQVEIYNGQADCDLNLNNITIDLLYPFESLQGQTTDEPNNTSIAIKVISPAKSIIITGDLHQEIENKLVNKYGSYLQSDILVAGHHGSKTSTGDLFLSTVDPKTVIIPVGTYNKFNHPSPETIEKLTKKNIEIKRTDLDSSVNFKL